MESKFRSIDDLIKALTDYACWTGEAQDDKVPRHMKISIEDMDIEMLEEAAAYLKMYKWDKEHGRE